MYGIVTRRHPNAARAQESRERAEREFFPELRKAPGFVSFSLVQGTDGVNTAISLWESQAQAEAFQKTGAGSTWARALDEFGHGLETRDSGEVVQHFGAEARRL